MKKRVDQTKLAEQIHAEYGIDLRNYRKPELVDAIGTLLSTPGVVGVLLLSTGLVLLASWAVMLAVFIGKVHWLIIPLILGYATFAGIISWSLVSLLRLAGRLLNCVAAILNLSLDILRNIAVDIKTADLRGKSLATVVSQLLRGVVYVIVLPTAEELLKRRLRILARPIIWTVKRVADQTVNQLAAWVENQWSGSSSGQLPNAVGGLPAAGHVHQITIILADLQVRVGAIHSVVKRRALLPFQVATFLGVLLLYTPLVFLFWLVA